MKARIIFGGCAVIAAVLLFQSCAKADEPTHEELVNQVRSIAGLVVANTDAIDELKLRVSKLESSPTVSVSQFGSVTETRMIEVPQTRTITTTATAWATTQPTYLYQSPVTYPGKPRTRTVYPRRVERSRPFSFGGYSAAAG